MLCSFLRHKGVPARLRCGFGCYFAAGWEDHWVCEHWDAAAGTWRLADAQIDDVLRARHSIGFDAADVPRTSFMTADQAWLHCRAGHSDFRSFGHGEEAGPWFVHVNVARDRLALHGIVTSRWDEWRKARSRQRRLGDGDVASTDEWARSPDRFEIARTPPWLAQ